MKKRLLLTLATILMLFASVGVTATASVGDEPPPTCNPLTDPRCK